jgi:hypothetical protein
MCDQFIEQRFDIKFCVKLSLETKHGALNMIPKANNEVCIGNLETADIPMTQQSSHVEITNEDNAHHVLPYQGYCSH